MAGIDRHTADPADGRTERDVDGSPTGTLHEGAMALVSRLVPETSADDFRRALLIGQEYLHSLGGRRGRTRFSGPTATPATPHPPIWLRPHRVN